MTATSNAPEAEPTEDELEALFDELSDQVLHSAKTDTNATITPSPAPATNEAEPSEDELEAIFDELSDQVLHSAKADDDTSNTPVPVMQEATSAESTSDAVSDDITAPAQTAKPASAADEASGSETSEKPLFDQLGLIVRQLHNSLRELGYDRAIQETVNEVTDTKSRLEYVATLTEQAATRVLNSIDEGLPQQDTLHTTAGNLEKRWQQLFEGELSIEEFKQLAMDAKAFSNQAMQIAEEERARLMEIMMAQDFQDITGQIIKKVVSITTRLETELAQLLQNNAPASAKNATVDLMTGPDVPKNALAQDDVDSLLASLGF